MPIELKVPAVGESITEVEIGGWLKAKGDAVKKDEPVVTLESEKATVELPAPAEGTLSEILKNKGDTAAVGEVIAYIEKDGKPAPSASSAKPEPKAHHPPSPNPDPSRPVLPDAKTVAEEEKEAPPQPAQPVPAGRKEEVVRMTRLRRTVAERLVEAQKTMALLTTFNEIDMSAVLALRKEHGESFKKKYDVKLGLMSFFVKASIEALKLIPQVNAEIRGTDIIYHRYYDMGVAIGGAKGLVVPILKNAELLSFAQIELAIGDFARRAQENKLSLEELRGGTFTITNGGVYGSLFSTPIVNPPQSGILGMHAIQERPIAHEGNVVIRPMMYVALTYDHRIVDGREAVMFLKRIREIIEEPARMLIEV